MVSKILFTVQDPDDIHQNDPGDSDDTQSPAIQGEKDSLSSDVPEESADIDDEMGKIGKPIDPEHPEPLGED